MWSERSESLGFAAHDIPPDEMSRRQVHDAALASKGADPQSIGGQQTLFDSVLSVTKCANSYNASWEYLNLLVPGRVIPRDYDSKFMWVVGELTETMVSPFLLSAATLAPNAVAHYLAPERYRVLFRYAAIAGNPLILDACVRLCGQRNTARVLAAIELAVDNENAEALMFLAHALPRVHSLLSYVLSNLLGLLPP